MFSERAFSLAGPSTWNALPDSICTVADPAKFQKLLKSHYFSAAFNICWLLLALAPLTVVMHLWPSFNRQTVKSLMTTTTMTTMIRLGVSWSGRQSAWLWRHRAYFVNAAIVADKTVNPLATFWAIPPPTAQISCTHKRLIHIKIKRHRPKRKRLYIGNTNTPSFPVSCMRYLNILYKLT